MPRESAGLLLYRSDHGGSLEVLLVHPGGPFFRKKDAGAWTIPKGEIEDGDEPLATARREFTEELGLVVDGPFRPLPSVKQKGGKIVHAWACEADLDVTGFRSNTFTMEWPPKSGRQVAFPEIDQAEWFDLDTARTKINVAQQPFLDALLAAVSPDD